MNRGLALVREFCEELFDSIFLPPARSVRTRKRTLADIPLTPAVEELLGTSIATFARYKVPAVAELIQSLKYDGNAHASRLAAALLADFLREEIAQARAFSPREIVLIPLPLHAKRLRERGFNQIERVLEKLPQEFCDGTLAHVDTGLLMRVRYRGPQTQQTRAKRIANMKDAFALADDRNLSNIHVIVIDDVATTGATLKSAAEPLEKAGARVTLVAIARA